MFGCLAVKALPILLIPCSNVGGGSIALAHLVKRELNAMGYGNVKTLDWSVIRNMRILDLERVMETVYNPTVDITIAEVNVIQSISKSAVTLYIAPYYNGHIPGTAKLMLDWASVRNLEGYVSKNQGITHVQWTLTMKDFDQMV